MRKVWVNIALGILLFAVCTASTMKCESPSDGYDEAGYPFRFYSYTAGKCIDPGCNDPSWDHTHLVLDIVLCIVVAAAARAMWKAAYKKA